MIVGPVKPVVEKKRFRNRAPLNWGGVPMGGSICGSRRRRRRRMFLTFKVVSMPAKAGIIFNKDNFSPHYAIQFRF